MSTNSSFLTSLYSDIQFMTSSLIVKMEEQARGFETMESILNYERYRSALRGTFKATSMLLLDIDVLKSLFGHTDRAFDIALDPKIMTKEELALVNAAHKNKIIETFEEKNDYYRQYLGLPDVKDTKFIYITDVKDVRPNVPIHKLSDEEFTIIINIGKYEKILKDNPTLTYLRYIGSYSLDPIAIREAKAYDIIKIDTPENALTKELFIKEYVRARRYIMSTQYDPNLFLEKDFYEGIMGIIILTQAIRNCMIIDPIMSTFFNEELMDAILRSYGIEQHFKGLPIFYKRKLIKNLDNIIAYKGTDTMLLDICKIFGYDNIKINRYYMLKTHNKDAYGRYKFDKLPDGSLDYDKMYNLDFLKCDVADGANVSVNSENIISYESVTYKDPYWQMTDQDIVSLKKEDFNLKMTDYISIEAAYNISQLMFELSYFINLIIDSRSSVSSLKLTNRYSYDGSSDLFTTIVLLMALTAKKVGFDGNVHATPVSVASIMKFNLTDVTAQVTDIIKTYKLNITVNDVLLARPTTVFTGPDEAITMYIKNSNIYKYIEEKISNAKTVKEYDGFNKLQNLLFVSSMMNKIFTKTDGTIAPTYLNMLYDLDMTLGKLVDDIKTDDDLENTTMYVLNQLQSFFNTDKLDFLFINTPDMHEKLIKVYFKKAVELFKYLDTQLDSIDVFFKMDDEASTARIFDEMHTTREVRRGQNVEIVEETEFHKTIYISDSIGISPMLRIID